MGIILTPPKRYKCSKCGSENCTDYKELPSQLHAGHYEGVRCNTCGHKTRTYKQSVFEEESGEYGKSFTFKPSEPIEF